MFAHGYFQIRKLAPILLAIYLPPMLVLVAVAAASIQLGIDVGRFTRDPAAIAEISPFTGVVSNLGVLIWTATAAVCLYTWAVLRHNRSQYSKSFFLYFGLVTGLLGVDDFFLLHEHIAPLYLSLAEEAVLVVYMCLMLSGLVMFRSVILKSEYYILISALGFFSLSLLADAACDSAAYWNLCLLLEDGFKLFGIFGWFAYFTRSCFRAVCGNIERTS